MEQINIGLMAFMNKFIKEIENNKELFSLVRFIGAFGLIGFIGLLIWLLG